MGLCGGQRLGRALLICINGVFLVFGLLLITLGAISMVQATQIVDQVPLVRAAFDLSDQGLWVIIAGVVLTVASVIGLIAAWKRIKKCIKIYGFILFLVLGLQITGVVIVLAQVGTNVGDLVDESVEGSYTSAASDPDKFDRVREVQTKFECCGYQAGDADTMVAPDCDPNGSRKWTDGCRAKLIEELEGLNNPLLYAAIAVVVVELLALAATLCLCCAKNDPDEDDLWTSPYDQK